MVKGFREFLMKGNVIDLAVAFVIGAAFASLVATFVSKIITPILAALQGPNSIGLGFHLRSGNDATFVDIGGLINAVIVFLITALVVYLLFVVPKQKFDEFRRRRAGTVEEVGEELDEQTVLLREIRDSLRHEH
jgi:large conductance mechanosensitive channel